MINGAVAEALERIADLMEIRGESGFRVNSYRRAARVVKAHPEDIAVVAEQDRLTDLSGIGQSTAEKIKEFIESGSMQVLTELESSLPPGLPMLLGVQGLGPKKVALMHEKLGVADVESLKQVIASGELAKLAGFGAQSVKRIEEGLTFLERSSDRTPLGIALPRAEAMVDEMAKVPGVKRIEMAGSIRRGAETIGDIDLLCEAKSGERVVKAFVEHPMTKRVLAAGSTKGSITVGVDGGRELQIDLRVVPAESFGAAWQYFTGSKEHNVRLRERAVRKKLRLNEYGLYDGEKQIAGKTEESIYKKLGVAYVPPEMREDAGEFDIAEPPQLVTLENIRGDLHMHTTASDGRSSILEMAEAAKACGYAYIAITDHSKSSAIANGLSVERLVKHIEDVRSANEKIKGITILTGCECDILANGSLDYPDEILAECEVVIASVHSGMRSGKVPPTQRTLMAMASPYVTMIGHPTGRLLGQRPPMDVDMQEIVRNAAETGTALEINASWQRLDLKGEHVRQAIEAGVILAINTDAHHHDGLPSIRYGITTARRGWATAEHVLNTRPLKSLKAWISKKRGRKA